MTSTTVALVCGTITALMAAYGIGRHMRLTHLPLIVKCAIPAVFAVLGFLHFVLLHVDAGFSRAVVIDTIPITALFVSMIYWFFILTILSDVVLFVRWALAKAQGQTLPTRSVFTIILSSIVGVMSFVFGLTSAWSALSEPEQEVITVEVKDLPKALENLKVVQLSDLHASNLFPASRTESVVAAVNALQPDLVLITGDFADGTIDTPRGYTSREKDLAPLKDLKATYGVYGVSGNHEYIGGAYQKLKTLIQNQGVTLLENAHQRLTMNGHTVHLVGVTDLAAYRSGETPHNLEAALANIGSDDLRILMDHQPRAANIAADPKYGIDLQLSGHTHGGHTGIVGTLASRANNGFLKGLYEIGDMTLYVNQGTGFWAGFPVRSGTWNEITVIQFKAK